MKLYQIWMATYTDQGMEGCWVPARLLGKQEGVSFKDACRRFVEANPEWLPEFFDSDAPSYWGDPWFDNEDDASRKNRGSDTGVTGRDGSLIHLAASQSAVAFKQRDATTSETMLSAADSRLCVANLLEADAVVPRETLRSLLKDSRLFREMLSRLPLCGSPGCPNIATKSSELIRAGCCDEHMAAGADLPTAKVTRKLGL